MKKCSVCKEVKSLDLFYVNNSASDKRQYCCKMCSKELARTPKAKKQQKTAMRKYHYKRKYGITIEEYNELLKIQNNRCAICNKHPTKNIKLAIDHCHKEGHVRGLLCTMCNVGLGNFKDNKNLLLKAVEYLGG